MKLSTSISYSILSESNILYHSHQKDRIVDTLVSKLLRKQIQDQVHGQG